MRRLLLRLHPSLAPFCDGSFEYHFIQNIKSSVMKKNIIALLVALFYLTFSSPLSAQKQKYVPEKGHWQLVSNIHDKKTVTVQFYTDQGIKMYEETVSNTRMNVARKKVRRQLYYALKEAYSEWTKNALVSSTHLIAKRN
jgi:hypothetical protein